MGASDRRTSRALLAIMATLAALGLSACGDDEETPTTTSATAPTTAPTGATGEANADALTPTGEPKDVVDAVTSCLEDAGYNVIENPSSVGGSEYQLVVNAGGLGVVYVFGDTLAAEDGLEEVDREQRSTGRESEVAGQTVISYLPEGQTLAPSAEELADLKSCTGAS
jgi:hypothetical protein